MSQKEVRLWPKNKLWSDCLLDPLTYRRRRLADGMMLTVNNSEHNPNQAAHDLCLWGTTDPLARWKTHHVDFNPETGRASAAPWGRDRLRQLQKVRARRRT